MRYGELLYLSGRVEDGLAMIRRGVALVPFNVDYHVILGYALYNMRRFGEAMDEFKRAGELDPSGAMAPWCLARLYTVQRREEEAIAAYLAALRQMLVPDRAPAAIEALEAEYRQRGWNGFARKELELADEGLRPAGRSGAQRQVRVRMEMAGRYAAPWRPRRQSRRSKPPTRRARGTSCASRRTRVSTASTRIRASRTSFGASASHRDRVVPPVRSIVPRGCPAAAPRRSIGGATAASAARCRDRRRRARVTP